MSAVSMRLLLAAGACIAAALALFGSWPLIKRSLVRITGAFIARTKEAGIAQKAEEIALSLVGIGAIAWVVVVLLLPRPGLLTGLLLLPTALVLAFAGFSWWLDYRARRRLQEFNDELELVLRLLASGLRVGLGVHQTLVVIARQAPEPARGEFARVLGQTSIGIPLSDAFDELHRRMPSAELGMMVRAIHVLSRSGGDLARILEDVASTINQRRTFYAKLRVLTAGVRASAGTLTAIPVGLLLAIILITPETAHAMFFTVLGRIGVGVALSLEIAGLFAFRHILRLQL